MERQSEGHPCSSHAGRLGFVHTPLRQLETDRELPILPSGKERRPGAHNPLSQVETIRGSVESPTLPQAGGDGVTHTPLRQGKLGGHSLSFRHFCPPLSPPLIILVSLSSPRVHLISRLNTHSEVSTLKFSPSLLYLAATLAPFFIRPVNLGYTLPTLCKV